MKPNPQQSVLTWQRFGSRHAWRLACAVALLGIALAPHAADPPAPKGTPDFALERQVIAAGGGRMDGGDFRVVGTIGQIDADVLHPASGGDFNVVGGFWAGLIEATPLEEAIFANGFED